MLVVPNVPQSFIFGSDFCARFNISLNFDNGTWNIAGKNTDLLFPIVESNSIVEHATSLSTDNLSIEQRVEIDKVIALFEEVSSKKRLGRTDKITLTIDTGDAKPFKIRQYLMSPYMLKILNQELDEMLQLGVVEPSHSPWNSPVILVKKNSGEFRFCFDGRKLNEVTKHDSYPLPRIDRILNMLRDAKFISTIDLRKAFWQIPLDESSKEKTAFSIPGRGLFHFNVVPFGLCNSAQTQQRLVDALFGPKYEPHIFTYLDDIIITSSSFEHHIELLHEVRDILKSANLTVNINKCEFFKTSLKYLGFVVDSQGLRTDAEKVQAMLDYPRPKTSTEIKRFVGLCSWYRKFIHDFSTLMAPINSLLKGKKKQQKIEWNTEAENAFLKIKSLLVEAPILSSPNFNEQFTIACDASDVGIGGFIFQELDGANKVIAYASRSLSKAERNYSVTERELLSLIFLLDKFRPYIEGTHFKVITDHSSLRWINNLKDPCGRLARWAVKLRQHTFDIVHQKGILNVVPDFLSRIPAMKLELNTISNDVDNQDQWYSTLIDKVKSHPDSYPQWIVKEDKLFKYIPSKNSLPTSVSSWKSVVPKHQRAQILKNCHDSFISSHLGFFKTLHRIQELYYWPKLKKDVIKYVRCCKTCQSQKMSNSAPLGLRGKERLAQYPFQIIAVDIMGPFPKSPKGFTYLLVVVDWFSKYTLLHPMRNAKAQSIVQFMENQVFLQFGPPQFIICDNATCFAGKQFKNFADTYEVQQIWFTPRYAPICNFVERVNRTIGQSIRSYVTEHKRWDTELYKIQFAINTAVHEVHKYTPSFVNFGRYIPTSGKYYGEVTSTDDLELSAKDRSEYVENISGLKEVYRDVQEKLHKAYERNARSYNLRRKDVSFEVGDKVWKRNKVLSDALVKFTAKLTPKFILCKVAKKVSKVVYELLNLDNTAAGRWHIKDLKPYFGSNSDVSDE